jgi:hypothetical protein
MPIVVRSSCAVSRSHRLNRSDSKMARGTSRSSHVAASNPTSSLEAVHYLLAKCPDVIGGRNAAANVGALSFEGPNPVIAVSFHYACNIQRLTHSSIRTESNTSSAVLTRRESNQVACLLLSCGSAIAAEAVSNNCRSWRQVAVRRSVFCHRSKVCPGPPETVPSVLLYFKCEYFGQALRPCPRFYRESRGFEFSRDRSSREIPRMHTRVIFIPQLAVDEWSSSTAAASEL